MSDEKHNGTSPADPNVSANPPPHVAPGAQPGTKPGPAPASASSIGPELESDIEASIGAGDIPAGQLRAIIEALQADLDEARDMIAAREAQLEAANDKVLRGFADIENMRKRVEREKEETAKYAITKLARDIVLVADNFERAIASVPSEARVDNPALVNLIEGVALTEREFLKTLERHGVRRVSPQGEAFNPHVHQAVMEQPNPDVPSGTVLQVFQVGYMIEDRVLRPAMVVVATGGPKVAKPADSGPSSPGTGASHGGEYGADEEA